MAVVLDGHASRVIRRLAPAGMKFDLPRFRSRLTCLGNPQNRFPAVHVAGTNGKGSVSALLQSALVSGGVRTGLYTSPHLVRWNERIRIGRDEISDRSADRWVAWIERRLARSGDSIFSLTQFELFTALAFVWFAHRRVECAVIEAGLGGRLDATNVLGNSRLAVITNIGKDHSEWLGETLVKIAREKAGIIQAGRPVVSGATGEAGAAIRRMAKERGARIVRVQLAHKLSKCHALPGAYQQQNVAVASTAARVLRKDFPTLTDAIVERGFRSTSWPGRFDRRKIKGVDGRDVILDGAHNLEGVNALVTALRREKIAEVDLIYGCLRDKPAGPMIRALSRVAKMIWTVPVESPRTAPPGKLARCPHWRSRAIAKASFAQAWSAALKQKSDRPLLVAGSIYLIGECLRRFERSLVSARN